MAHFCLLVNLRINTLILRLKTQVLITSRILPLTVLQSYPNFSSEIVFAILKYLQVTLN